MQPPVQRAPTSPPRTPTRPHQLDLSLDHPRLRGLSLSERRAVIALLAHLFLEANGIATREDADERA